MNKNLSEFCVPQCTSILDAMAKLDANTTKIILVLDADGRLNGTLTDGDVRRAMLAGITLEQPVDDLLTLKAGSSIAVPVTAPAGSDRATQLAILKDRGVFHLPLVDEEQRVVDLVTLGELAPAESPALNAVIMAGGAGTRLRPLTEDLPKPMLPVGERPLMELIIQQLRQAGIKQVSLTTHYKKDVVVDHFGDGSDFGVDIQYVDEDQPLGTAGALSRLPGSDDPLLVINGDILTRVDFRAMLDFHNEQHAEMTVAVRQHETPVPFGVVEIDGVTITGISEKPVIKHLISAGIYLLDPSVCRDIPDGRPYDMPELIGELLSQGRKVVSFPVREYWLDVGRPADYEQAQLDAGPQGFNQR